MTTTLTTETTPAPARGAAGARPRTPRRPFRLWRGAAGPLVTVVAALVAAVQALRLWDWRPGLPLAFSSDALPVLMQVREFMTGSWFGLDPAVGAPFGSNSAWFPTGNAVHLPLIRLLALFSDSPATVATMFFVLQFPFAALSAYWLARQLGTSRPMSVVVGVLFAVLPGHQLWFGHLWLSAYWVVPLALWLVLQVGRGTPLWPPLEDLRTPGPKRRHAVATAARTAFVFMSVGLADAYYVAFTLILLTAALVLRLGTGTRPRAALAGIVATATTAALCVGSLLMATRGRSADVVTSTLPANRGIGESEVYAGKLIDLLLPWYEHRAAPLNFLTWAYSIAATPSVERPALGVVALVGVAGLLWSTVAALASRRPPQACVGLLAALLLVCLAFYSKGGLGSVVALFVTPQIRTWSRFVVFIDLFGLLAVGLWVTNRPRLRVRRLAWPVAAAIVAVGVLDQTNPAVAPDYRAIKAEQADLSAFGADLHTAVGSCSVFQLPVVQFPEEPPPGRMDDYDHFRPSLMSPPGLRWSYGAIRGTNRADWQLALPVNDPPRLLDELAAAGFCAVEINRAGYAGVADPTPALAKALGPPAARTSDGNLEAYDLAPVAAVHRARSAQQQSSERADVLQPSLVTLAGSLVEVSADGTPRQWTGPTARVQVSNMGSTHRRLRVSLSLQALDGRPGTASVTGPGVATTPIRLGGRPIPVMLEVDAAPGLSTLTLASTATVQPIPGGDQGSAALQVSGLRVTDESSPANASTGQAFAADSPRPGR